MKTNEQSTVYGRPYYTIPVPNSGKEWATQLRWCDEQFGQTTSSITHAEGPKKRMSLPDEPQSVASDLCQRSWVNGKYHTALPLK